MMQVFLLGFGKVGREVVKILLEPPGVEDLQLVGVSSSRGSVLVEGPADKAELLRLAKNGEKLDKHKSFVEGLTPPDIVTAVSPDIALIAIPPSYESGEPNRSIYYSLINEGINIVTADKTVLALEYREVMRRAAKAEVFIGYRATVAAGTPVLDIARALRYRGVERVRGVLNATTNVVLGLVEKGMPLERAIEESIRLGFAEPDPSIDLYGWDAAAKISIIASELGIEASLKNVTRTPVTSEVLAEVGRRGKLKQIAEVDLRSGALRVYPSLIEKGDPLERAEGERNVVVFELEGDVIVIEGPAGPAWRTARVMIGDALEISARMREAL
jgi:homoserine dehydrogenase